MNCYGVLLEKWMANMDLEGVNTENSQMMTNSIPSLLALARQYINQGNPSLALEAVVMAMNLFGGEHAVYWALHRAREMYQNRTHENAAAEELAALFAECAIAEASPNASSREPLFTDANLTGSSMLTDTSKTSILAKSGRMQVVMDAFADGSSFVCSQCGGLVSNLRRDENVAYWCGQPS